MVVYLVLVEVGGEWRLVKIDVRNEFLVLFVPQVLTYVLLELVALVGPHLVFLFVRRQFNEIVYRKHEHGIVVNVNCHVAVFVNFNAPGMFGLHIAPVGSGCADNQSVKVVELFA